MFGPPEKFILMTFVLLLFCTFGANRYAILSMLLGLMLGTVGPDPLRGEPRYDFNLFALSDGLDFIVVAIGLLGVGEVLASWDSRTAKLESSGWRDALPRWHEIRTTLGTMIRAGLVGFGMGILPGAGTAAASFMAYTIEKRLSRFGHEFGTGRIEGVAAPESANNAAVAGALVPMLTLGIPGSASTALMLAALVVAGIPPGPLLFTEHPALVWGVIASLFIANVVLVFLSIVMIPLFVKVSSIQYVYIFPIIIMFAVVGAYSVNGDMFEVWLMIGFGVAGYLCKRVGIPLAPMILGLVLGPLTETSLAQSLAMSRGDVMIFIERPVSLGLLIACVAPFAVISAYRILRRRAGIEPA
ncbi:tripartite tricarboxylate transporter permease [Aquamicrobium defluvii]|nr:tripartite tricarboxylate transporter permease [Aquamicrobium defluvii]